MALSRSALLIVQPSGTFAPTERPSPKYISKSCSMSSCFNVPRSAWWELMPWYPEELKERTVSLITPRRVQFAASEILEGDSRVSGCSTNMYSEPVKTISQRPSTFPVAGDAGALPTANPLAFRLSKAAFVSVNTWNTSPTCRAVSYQSSVSTTLKSR